jgi:Tol biopolymer transport system component/DNA-binding winged helix-turn-helix (wHTH) protein
MKSVAAEEKRPAVQFGEFTLNFDQHSLYSDCDRVHLTEKPLETLIFLVKNPGRVVEKSELFESVWNGTYVTEDVLVHAVREIRRVLGDDKENPKFIQTVPRRGYRFIADVIVEPISNGAVAEGFFVDREIDIRDLKPSAVSHTTRRPILWAMIAFLAITFLAIGYLYMQRPPTLMHARYETQKQITSGEFSAGKPAFSPDGKLILCVWSSPETRGFGDIFVISQDGRSIPITKHENPSGDMPVFTADSTHVVFARYREGSGGDRLPDLQIVPSSGVTPPRLYVAEASGAGFSSDGKFVAYTKHLPTQKALWLSPTSNLDEHREVAAQGFTPRFSPDGKWLAYSSSNPEGGPGDLWVVDTATFSHQTNLTLEPSDIYGLAWTADSASLIFCSKRSGTHMLWQASLRPGDVKPLMPTFGGYASAPAVSPDGRELVFQYGRIAKDIWLGTVGSAQIEKITTDEINSNVRLSPSGKQLASFVQRQDFGRDLRVIDLNETDRKEDRITLSDRDPEFLCWIDEKHIAYIANDMNRGQVNVVVVNTGNGMRTVLTEFIGKAGELAVSPAGQTVAVVLKGANGSQQIVVRNLETRTDISITEGGEFTGLRWLEDGAALTWSGPDRSANPDTGGVWRWDRNTSSISRVVSDGFGPVWSRDKSTVYFAKGRGAFGLWQKRAGDETEILNWPDNVHYFDIADKRIAFIQANEIVRAQIYSVELVK